MTIHVGSRMTRQLTLTFQDVRVQAILCERVQEVNGVIVVQIIPDRVEDMVSVHASSFTFVSLIL